MVVAREVPVRVWRKGLVVTLKVRPGRLGVILADDPAPLALARRQESAHQLRTALRGDAFSPLPGTRREVEAITALTAAQHGRVEKFLGAAASEEQLQRLAAQERLRSFRYLHLATHGKPDLHRGLCSYLALAQGNRADPLTAAGEETCDGKLTAEEILRTWKLNADLVTLSACETGLGQKQGGEGYLGFAQALFLAGARSLVLSQWQVDDQATTLLMIRFYENLLGGRAGLEGPVAKAAALAEAKRWLRNLTAEEANRLLPERAGGARGQPRRLAMVVEAGRPYAHPYYWSSFVLIGDPGDVTQAVPVLAPVPGVQPAQTTLPGALGLAAGVLLALLGLALVVRRRQRPCDRGGDWLSWSGTEKA
jgi:CHAT domain-containing protein